MTGYPNLCTTCGFGYDDRPRCDCAEKAERERVMRPGELSRWTLNRLERERRAAKPTRVHARAWMSRFDPSVLRDDVSVRVEFVCTLSRRDAELASIWGLAPLHLTIEPARSEPRPIGATFTQRRIG